MPDCQWRRRDFLAALLATGFVPPALPGSTKYPVHFRKPNPYEALVPFTDPSADVFRCEKEAAEVERRLTAWFRGEPLPFAADFKGSSPLPVRYKTVADGVHEAEFGSTENFVEGLRKWLASLGQIRRFSVFLLPGDLVRYEVASEGAYRVGYWKQRWNSGHLEEFRPVSETLVSLKAPLFEDITGDCFAGVQSFQQQLAKGNSYWRSRLDSATGIDLYGSNGIAVGDIDNDGFDEIYVCQPAGLPNRLYRNRGDGTLIDITDRSGTGILDDTSCALFLDLRNSGVQDMVVLGSVGPLLFTNNGHGNFTHVPDAFRFKSPPQGSFTGMAAADYDRDGRVDIYVCSYVYFQSEDQYTYPVPYHNARNGPPNFLFRNRLNEAGGGYFEDVTVESGLNENNDRYSFAPTWCDLDGDGWPDLYVANDFGSNNLYRNRNGKFRDEAVQSGVADIAPGMSAAWFDYNGDGRPDLYVSNMWTAAGQRVVDDEAFAPGKNLKAEYHSHTRGNSLFRNAGSGKFDDVTAHEGVAMGRWAWSADAFDFDSDGSPEIYIATGMLTNTSEKDLNSFFWRQVVAKSPVTAQPAPEYENGWNAINQLIREDYSWCGREPNVFYKRVKPAAGGAARYYDFSGVSGLDFAEDSRAFAVTDIDGDGHLDIVLKSRLAPQVRVLRNNSAESRRTIAVRLQGTKSNRDAIGARVTVNGFVQYLSAGSGYLSQHSKQLHFGLGESKEADLTIHWPSGMEQHFAKLPSGFAYDIQEGSDEIKKTAFRSRSAFTPSSVVAENRPAWDATWLWEPVPLPDAQRGPGFLLLKGADAPPLPSSLPVQVIDVRRASGDLLAQYSIFRRYLFDLRSELELPLLLLIDDRSRAHKVYFSIPAADSLASDLETLRAGKGAALALPFPGRYYKPPHRNYFKFGAAFYWAGYPDQAIPYLDEAVRRSPGNWKALQALGHIHLEAQRWKAALDNYRLVLTVRPNQPSALLGAGEAYAGLNDYASAEKVFRHLLEGDPPNADAANQLGLIMAKQNRMTEAKDLFQRAISIDRRHAGAINNLGVLYTTVGKPEDAIAAFRYGIEVAPDDSSLYMNLGRLYVSMGRTEQARDVMRQLLDRRPGDPLATRALRDLESR